MSDAHDQNCKCRACWYARNKEFSSEQSRKYRSKNWLRMWAVKAAYFGKRRKGGDVTGDEILKILEAQGGKCAITGVVFEKPTRGDYSLGPSVDRLDPEGPYTASNIRVTLYAVNAFRGKMTDKQAGLIAGLMARGFKNG